MGSGWSGTLVVRLIPGRVKVQLGFGSNRLSAYLMESKGGNRRPQSLRTITPHEIQGGPGMAPIVVQLSAEEIQKAIEELQKEPAKK